MKTYEFGIHHDNGDIVLRVRANSLLEAKTQVVQSEKCPDRSITFWRIVPTIRQIKRTKSLLRGI